MIKLKLSISLSYEITNNPSDFIFNIHAAQTDHQVVVIESMLINQALKPQIYSDTATGARIMRMKANPGLLSIQYSATVEINHHTETPSMIEEIPIAELPPSILPYVYPSRYCQSDRLRSFATREFGQLRQGYWRAQAIQDWVLQRTRFMSGSSNSSTSAADTLIEQVGVCRDFAHLMIALCRAVNIPARFVTGIDYGADPALGPTDFHAYVEVFLGNRWYLFDPTGISPPMGLVRIGSGRDAADVSFATIFGSVSSTSPLIHIEAVEDVANGYTLPLHITDAISSMAIT
jgi:transglutaminase-like putative cysteine protease